MSVCPYCGHVNIEGVTGLPLFPLSLAIIGVFIAGLMIGRTPEFLGKKPHGLRVGPDGNVWTVDLEAHRVMKWTPQGRLLMNLGTGAPSADNNAKYSFNRPATLSFRPNGDFFVADGYGNSRVVHYSKDGEYLGQYVKGAPA